MLIMPQIGGFITFILISTFTPGPNNIMSLNNAARVGLRKALRFNVGIFFGFLIVMVLCAFAGSALYATIPHVKIIMSVVGASYILYLAWKTIRSSTDFTAEAKAQSFVSGFLLQFVNPKIMLYGLMAMSSYILPYYRTWWEIGCFALLLTITGSSANVSWTLFGHLFKRLMVKHEKIILTIMALLLVYCAAELLLGLF
jgi:threonine/homoserine/homoserine lactone efflux protein